MFFRYYLTQVLSTQFACFIDWRVRHNSVLLKVIDSLSSVQILKQKITREKKTCEKIEEE